METNFCIMQTKELEILNKIGNSQKVSKAIVTRAHVLSYYLSIENKRKTSRDLDKPRSFIQRWTKEWESKKKERLEYWELHTKEEVKDEAYKRFIINLLGDEKRSGKPETFTKKEKEQIVALALENPMDLNLPFTHWTGDLLAQEVTKRGIVKKISGRHISRILKKSAVVSS